MHGGFGAAAQHGQGFADVLLDHAGNLRLGVGRDGRRQVLVKRQRLGMAAVVAQQGGVVVAFAGHAQAVFLSEGDGLLRPQLAFLEVAGGDVRGGQHAQHALARGRGDRRGRVFALHAFAAFGVVDGALVFADAQENAGQVAQDAGVVGAAERLDHVFGAQQGFNGLGELALHGMHAALGAKRVEQLRAGLIAQHLQHGVERGQGVVEAGDAGVHGHQLVQHRHAISDRDARIAGQGLGACFHRRQGCRVAAGVHALEFHGKQPGLLLRVQGGVGKKFRGQGLGFVEAAFGQVALQQFQAGGCGAFGG